MPVTMKEHLLHEANIAEEVLNIVNAVILVMDRDGRIVLFNKAAESLTGYSFEEVKGKCPWDCFILPEEVDGVRSVFAQLTSGDFPNSHINHWITKAGSHRLIDWSNTSITGENGAIVFIIATGIDITDRKDAEQEIEKYQKNLELIIAERTAELNHANEQLEIIARIDGTTGIYNRRYFNEALETEWRRAMRTQGPISLMMCDVDYFKNYNDTYGHVAGDKCLKIIATTLDNAINRASDLVARYGGEEFAIILPGLDSTKAMELANRLIGEIRGKCLPYTSSPVGDVVTLSIGVATMQAEEPENHVAILSAADKALYKAKMQGRNRAQQYSADT